MSKNSRTYIYHSDSSFIFHFFLIAVKDILLITEDRVDGTMCTTETKGKFFPVVMLIRNRFSVKLMSYDTEALYLYNHAYYVS